MVLGNLSVYFLPVREKPIFFTRSSPGAYWFSWSLRVWPFVVHWDGSRP